MYRERNYFFYSFPPMSLYKFFFIKVYCDDKFLEYFSNVIDVEISEIENLLELNTNLFRDFNF